jgi:dienelactone hydrolase
MADVVFFHHAQGLTVGVQEFAAALSDAGHVVTLPDLYGGRTYDDIDEGVAYADAHFTEVEALVAVAAAAHPDAVLAGMSMGAFQAQRCAMRHGAPGLLLLHSGNSSADMELLWPGEIRVQIHMTVDDPWCEVTSARALAAESGGELFLYPGDAHLFTDSSLPSYDALMATQVLERSLEFLAPSSR